jgi:hypothetical protein
MTARQIRVLWGSGVLLSMVLFYLGIVAPHFAAVELGEVRLQVEGHAAWEMPSAFDRKADLERRATRNYYTGLVAPIAILSLCGLFAAGPRHPSSPMGGNRQVSL